MSNTYTHKISGDVLKMPIEWFFHHQAICLMHPNLTCREIALVLSKLNHHSLTAFPCPWRKRVIIIIWPKRWQWSLSSVKDWIFSLPLSCKCVSIHMWCLMGKWVVISMWATMVHSGVGGHRFNVELTVQDFAQDVAPVVLLIYTKPLIACSSSLTLVTKRLRSFCNFVMTPSRSSCAFSNSSSIERISSISSSSSANVRAFLINACTCQS